jgi:hypothetical protein
VVGPPSQPAKAERSLVPVVAPPPAACGGVGLAMPLQQVAPTDEEGMLIFRVGYLVMLFCLVWFGIRLCFGLVL